MTQRGATEYVLLVEYCLGDQTTKYEMGETFKMHGRGHRYVQ
jgi:hypothetical protein